jgi:transcription initiation factor TFIID subunit 13
MHGGKLRTEDLLFVLRNDPKKHARVEELLYMNEDLKRARKAFEVDEDPAMAAANPDRDLL